MPIEIEASFDSLDSGTLAAARPSTFFCSSTVCAPVGLVNQLVEEDRKPDDPDIEITMSDSKDWYYGLDGNPGGNQHDFVSVVLHEIGHALGFFDSFRVDESTEEAEYGLGDDNIPTVFDFFIFDTEINRLVDEDEYTNPSTELTDAVTGITLFWERCCMDRGGDGIRPFPSGSVRRYVRTQAVRVRSLCSGLSGRPGSP